MDYSHRGIQKKRAEINAKMPKFANMFGAFFYQATLIIIVAAGLAGCFAAVGIFRGVLASSPDISTIDVRPTGYSSTVYDSQGNQITKLVATNSNRIYQTIDKIPIDVQHAFVAIEDERFYEHNGIDIKGIFRAAYIGLTQKDFSQGASTITQQLIKNNVFTTWTSESSFTDKLKRKIQEQFLATRLEKRPDMTKDAILELYLNTINLGQNTLGVQAASLRYFNKPVSELDLSEGSVIAAITSNPSRYNPISHPDNNAVRRKLVLDRMLEQGYITESAYQQAINDDVYSRIQTVNMAVEKNSINSYFVDAMIKQVMSDMKNKLGYSDNQAYNMLYSGGLQIFATQDPRIQKICDDVCSDPETYPEKTEYLLDYQITATDRDGNVQNFSSQMMALHFKEEGRNGYDRLYQSEEDARADADAYKAYVESQGYTIVNDHISITAQPQISLTVADQATGYIKGIVGGRGAKTASLTLNRATDTMRQPGSTFKVVSTYAPAFDTGQKTLASVSMDEPFNYVNGRPVSNWYSGYKGVCTMRYGIEQSLNIITVKTLTDITPQLGYEYLLKFGFTTLVDNEVLPDGSVATDITQALALGGITHGVKNHELNAAYATIANKGVYIEPTFYTKILDHDGNVLIDNTRIQGRRVLRESTAYCLTSAMEDVVTKGTGGAVRFEGQKLAGKTGTTSDNKDVWFAGFSPYYTCTTWAGYDNNEQLSDSAQRGLAKTVWKAVMSRIHEGFPEKDFEKPESVVTALACNQSGNLAADFCQAMGTAYVEYFDKDFVPKEPCTGHLTGDYYMCALTGQAASETCPVRVPGVPIVGGWCPHSVNADGTVRTDPTPAELAQAIMAATGQTAGEQTDPLQAAQDAVAGLTQQTPENPQPVPDLSQMIPVQPNQGN
ncbi:MAG: transglycosylase domain-containing protein [Lachnospiraceae bacterium]|nr:transglycosylase domain-containing protein [Lachnospiraceae bacterium]